MNNWNIYARARGARAHNKLQSSWDFSAFLWLFVVAYAYELIVAAASQEKKIFL